MNNNNDTPTSSFRCHYEVLGVERNADAATIKKAHRKLALQWHPDKNIGNNNDNNNNDASSHQFLAVQQAYECLSDAAERKWYDEHRDALLRGWTVHGDNDQVDILFDLVPYMYAGCYNGYEESATTSDSKSFYAVYNHVFQEILQGEMAGGGGEDRSMIEYLSAVAFGNAQSSWDDVAAFYQAWESFSSTLSFAWADAWDLQQAEHRQVRRAMEDENKKARRQARRTRNDDVLALVQFVKRRDPRVKERWRKAAEEKEQQQQQLQQQVARKKKEKKKAMEQWRQDAELQMAAAEEEDRKAGRIRLADLADDYDYGGGKKKKGKKKKNKSRQTKEISDEEEGEDTEELKDSRDPGDVETGEDIETETPLEPDNDNGNGETKIQSETQSTKCDEEESDSDEEPGLWRCECCRKDFKSEGQMENHLNSKKHKVAWKRYESKVVNQLKQKPLNEQMAALDVDD